MAVQHIYTYTHTHTYIHSACNSYYTCRRWLCNFK